MDEMEVVSAVQSLLVERVGQDRFALWLAPARMSFAAGKFSVAAANSFLQNWLRGHYREEIEAACVAVIGCTVAVEFRIDETLAQAAPSPGLHQPAATKKSVTHSPESGNEQPGDAGPQKLRLHQPQPGGKTHSPAQPAQPPSTRASRPGSADEAIPRRKFATLDSFVVGASNRMAHTSAHTAAERPGSFTPLLIYGPSGTGKTHLLEGIWTAARTRRDNHNPVNAVFLSAEQYTTYFVEALRGSGLPSFRRKYRGVDLLIIDDLQFLAGKQATLTELLHTMDAVSREGRQLVFSADRAPRDLGALGPELTTRLSEGMVCPIELPDHAMRSDLVRHFAARREFEVPADVATYVAGQFTGGARELSGAVNRLDAARRLASKPLTLVMAEEALHDIVRDSSRPVCLADVEHAVCDVFGLPPDSLQSDRRSKSVSEPRMLAMWLARKHTRAGLSEIGRHFGRRSHSTVISAQKRVSDWLTRQGELHPANRACSIEETIRRVEERLRNAAKRAG